MSDKGIKSTDVLMSVPSGGPLPEGAALLCDARNCNEKATEVDGIGHVWCPRHCALVTATPPDPRDAELARLRAWAAVAVEALRAAEWQGTNRYSGGETESVCPVCRRGARQGHLPEYPHRPGCVLRRALSAAPPAGEGP